MIPTARKKPIMKLTIEKSGEAWPFPPKKCTGDLDAMGDLGVESACRIVEGTHTCQNHPCPRILFWRSLWLIRPENLVEATTKTE